MDRLPPITSDAKLPFYERLGACLILSIITLSIIFNLSVADKELPKTSTPHTPSQPILIEITIEGAVQHPGVYRVKKGTTVQQVLDQAHPLDDANLKRIKLDSKIQRRRTIKVIHKS